VSGKATIGGGTVHALKEGGVYTPGSRWTILSADGGAAALKTDSRTTDTTFTTLGLDASTRFDLAGTSARAHGTLGWRHAFGDVVPRSTHALAGGDAFTVAGVPIAEDAAIIEAGLDFDITDNATLGIAYQGQIASDARQHGVTARLGIRF
ncbi:MAG TPA: autotransporter domain-containing protein, partial [Pararhizobium sp.]|nr:autotransporter domain-containing protein [Pararhizobium sp.]